MTADFEFRSADLEHLGKHLDDAADDVRRKALDAIRKSGDKMIPDIKAAALSKLPSSGGLAAKVAEQTYTARPALVLGGAAVRISGEGMKELGDIDRGIVRHPVYGDRTTWVAQSVTPGFFSETVKRRMPAVQKDIESAMEDIAKQIVKGI